MTNIQFNLIIITIGLSAALILVALKIVLHRLEQLIKKETKDQQEIKTRLAWVKKRQKGEVNGR